MIADFAKEKVFWTRKMNLKLVKFIESKTNIWNPKHPKYTSVEYRDRTYSEFASKYGNEFTGQAVKDRWTNIRSTFANYLRKLNASRSKGEEYKINWHLWDACQFLLKVNKKVQNGVIMENGTEDDNKNFQLPAEWTSEEDIPSVDPTEDPNGICKSVAENLVKILQGVQNDAFGLDNTRNGKVGRAVSTTLSQISPYHAARVSKEIMEILYLYDKDNPENPNNYNKNLHEYTPSHT